MLDSKAFTVSDRPDHRTTREENPYPVLLRPHPDACQHINSVLRVLCTLLQDTPKQEAPTIEECYANGRPEEACVFVCVCVCLLKSDAK